MGSRRVLGGARTTIAQAILWQSTSTHYNTLRPPTSAQGLSRVHSQTTRCDSPRHVYNRRVLGGASHPVLCAVWCCGAQAHGLPVVLVRHREGPEAVLFLLWSCEIYRSSMASPGGKGPAAALKLRCRAGRCQDEACLCGEHPVRSRQLVCVVARQVHASGACVRRLRTELQLSGCRSPCDHTPVVALSAACCERLTHVVCGNALGEPLCTHSVLTVAMALSRAIGDKLPH